MFALIQKTQELYGEQFANCGTKTGNHGLLTVAAFARIVCLPAPTSRICSVYSQSHSHPAGCNVNGAANIMVSSAQKPRQSLLLSLSAS